MGKKNSKDDNQAERIKEQKNKLDTRQLQLIGEKLNQRKIRIETLAIPLTILVSLLSLISVAVVSWKLGHDENLDKAKDYNVETRIKNAETKEYENIIAKRNNDQMAESIKMDRKNYENLKEADSIASRKHVLRLENSRLLAANSDLKTLNKEIKDRVDFGEIAYHLKILKSFPLNNGIQGDFLYNYLMDRSNFYHKRVVDSLEKFTLVDINNDYICNAILYFTTKRSDYRQKIFGNLEVELKSVIALDFHLHDKILLNKLWSLDEKKQIIKILMDELGNSRSQDKDKVLTILYYVANLQSRDKNIKLHEISFPYFLNFVENCWNMYKDARSDKDKTSVLRDLYFVCPQLFLSLYYRDMKVVGKGVELYSSIQKNPQSLPKEALEDFQKRMGDRGLTTQVILDFKDNLDGITSIYNQIVSKYENDIPIPEALIFDINKKLFDPWTDFFIKSNAYDKTLIQNKMQNGQI